MIGRRGTITWGPRALTLFTDRYEAIRGFACYLNDDPARPEIIFFHGDGGNGKSLLLRYLRQHCCKRLPADEWLRAKTLHGDAFKTALEQSARAEAVPVASLDSACRRRASIARGRPSPRCSCSDVPWLAMVSTFPILISPPCVISRR